MMTWCPGVDSSLLAASGAARYAGGDGEEPCQKRKCSREIKISADEALKKALLPENGCSHMYGDVRV